MAYCYDGKTYETIKEMAEEYGIDRQRIYSFRRRGWSLEDAMQMCVNDVRGRGRLFEYNGKLYRSPKALAEEYGLPWNSLAHYIQRCKTVEEAVDRCKEAQEKKIMLWGKKYQSRYEVATAFGIREISISARIHTRNRTLEEIVLELLQKEPICFEGKSYNTLVELCAEYTYEGEMRKEKLLALRRFYQFCVKHQVADIETMTLDKEQQFEQELAEEFKGRKKRTVFGILRTSRKILFIQASEIHWQANVWFLERFHFSKERMNPSKPIELVSFKEVTNLENQKILQKYLRYLFGITDLCISTIRIKLLELRTFLVHFNGEKKPIYEMEAEKIQKYLEGIRNQNTREATANGRIFMILQFYNFLVVKRYLKKIPFRHEYYLQKEVRVHNDRSVPEGVYTEILSKLAEFPEHLRLMFLHLWCTGIRGSEVCTLTGDGYEEKDGDYWLKVYQVKMKTYKRIPIPEALYKLVQVYKKKYQIGPEEYLFQNQTGGAFRYGTFRYQMLKYCEKYQIADGEYLFKSHDYRHNLATLYYDSGISLQAVRDYLGHEYEEMTRQYVDYMPKKLEKASEAYFQEETHSFAAELMKGEFHG